MAEKKTAYCGLIMVVPPENTVAKSSSKSVKSQSFENKITSKTAYNDYGSGCTAKFSKTEKSGGFVDGRNGNPGYKQEVHYKSSLKVNDKIQGKTTLYETEVKHKKVTTHTKPNKSSGGVEFKKLGGPSKVSGGFKCKAVTTYSKPSKGSGGSGSRSYSGSKKNYYYPY